MTTGHHNIILVDGESRRRAAITHCLSGSGIHVEPFENAEELSGHWPRADVIVAHDETGAIRDLVDHMPASGHWLPIVAFSESAEPRRIVDAIVEGAVDYVCWPFTPEVLAESLDKARARAASLGNAKLREARARSRIERLSQREREVLSGIATGLSNRLIGERLSISPRTVEIHRANMLNKIGANHTSEAIRIAIEAELVR